MQQTVATFNPIQKPSFLATFSRSQVSSMISSAVDFGSLFICTEFFHVWYVSATALGAFLGALANFLINRYWSFNAAHGKLTAQAKRYIMVSALSLVLNTGGVYAMTEYVHTHYAISVGIVSFIVGVVVNYPLHRHFVYKTDH